MCQPEDLQMCDVSDLLSYKQGQPAGQGAQAPRDGAWPLNESALAELHLLKLLVPRSDKHHLQHQWLHSQRQAASL